MARVEKVVKALNQESGLNLQIAFNKQILVALLEEKRVGLYQDFEQARRLHSNPQDPR